MAADLTGVVAVQPYNGERLSQSPQNLVITFNLPNITFDASNADFQLEAVNRDGTLTPVFDLTNPPPEVVVSGTELIIPLQESVDPFGNPPYNLTLQPGDYEIELVAGAGISIDASGANGPGPALWDPSQPHVISKFTVLGSGATLAGATPLGTIGSTVRTVTGSVNPDDYHAAVEMYQFTLAKGHLWQVGLSVAAHSIGSGLLPALTLFDAQGNVLATREAGTGLPRNPNDPYLFAGLAPGTYFVGVSGAGNLPGGSNGYDPFLGIPGRAGINQPGGPFEFQLGLVARSHDQSTSLVNFTVDRADPFDPSPTGLTLTFNGPIDLSKLFVPDTQVTALEVVDSSGRVWPITAEEYRVTDARLIVIFNQPLPAGHYSLLIPAQGGLIDLAGQPVTAARNASRVLAAWTVAPSTPSSVPHNLGVLWAATADGTNSTLARAFSVTTDLAPGQSQTYRWVVTVPGSFKLQTQMGSGAVAVVNLGNGQTTVLDPGSTHQLNNYLMFLGDGVYGLRFVNVGSQRALVHWTLKIASLDWEKIVDNGVSQESALSLMLFAPTPSDPGGNAIASLQAIGGPAATSGNSGSSGPLTASLFVTLNTGLIGLPTPGGLNVAPVGPTVEAGSIAVADSSTGLQPGIRYESTSASSPGPGDGDQLGEAQPTGAGTVANDQAIRLATNGADLRLDSETTSARADERALAQADWVVHLGTRIKSWLKPSSAASVVTTPAAAPLEARAMVGNDGASGLRDPAGLKRNKRFTSTAQADIGAVASLMMVGAVVYRLREPLQKWWRRRDRLALVGPATAKSFCQGPHPVSTRARATTRARRVHSVR